MEINKYIDHTLLKQDASLEGIKKLLKEAKEYHFKSVCVNPCFVKKCHEELKDSDVVKKYLGNDFSITPEDMYGYGRAYQKEILPLSHSIVILDSH